MSSFLGKNDWDLNTMSCPTNMENRLAGDMDTIYLITSPEGNQTSVWFNCVFHK